MLSQDLIRRTRGRRDRIAQEIESSPTKSLSFGKLQESHVAEIPVVVINKENVSLTVCFEQSM